MRQAFAACMALLVLVVVVAVRFGRKESPPRAQPIVDAGVADAPVDAAVVAPDAAPPPKKKATRPTPKRKSTATRPEPAPVPAPTPTPVVVPPPVRPPPARPACTPPPNPAGCPAKEPNVNRPCDAEGARCVYGTSCCPPVYVCNGGAFEAWFQSCP